MDAMEGSDSSGSDTVCNQQKSDIRQGLYSCAANHKGIFSTSSNYSTYHKMKAKRASELQVHVYGGLSAVSLLRKSGEVPGTCRAKCMGDPIT